jgi:hypothetical protein
LRRIPVFAVADRASFPLARCFGDANRRAVLETLGVE